MGQYVLGISAFYHDSSACLLKDGQVIAAAAEERFTRKKHDSSFPNNAIEFCLSVDNIPISEVDYIAYYEKPILKFDRILSTFIRSAPRGFIPFKMAIQSWFKEKLWVSSNIRKKLQYDGEIRYCKHHESHAASSYFTSPFIDAAFLTLDGVGEKASTTFGVAQGNTLTTMAEVEFPHSIGLLYSAFTYYCGFKVNSGEYKLMGLAPYGTPKYASKIWEHLIKQHDNGFFELNMKYFSYEYGLTMIGSQFEQLFGQPARTAESEMSQFYKDVAASIQQVTEELVLELAKHVKSVTKKENLCLAGGVALNCVSNAKIKGAGFFKNIWIQPAAGDSGTSLGAALQVWYQHLNNDYLPQADSVTSQSYLGPSFSDEEIVEALNKHKLPHQQQTRKQLVLDTVESLKDGLVVGWFQDAMEFGPRALGNRSILANPSLPDMQQKVNLKIKKREGFRPFAPIVMEEHAKAWFDLEEPSKSMLYTYPCAQPKAVPSCVHVDGSSRVQTLNSEDNKRMHELLSEFYNQTGCPVLINTSFNERGEPMVCSPSDAILCFLNTEMDALVMGNYLVKKSDLTKDYSHLNKSYELD